MTTRDASGFRCSNTSLSRRAFLGATTAGLALLRARPQSALARDAGPPTWPAVEKMVARLEQWRRDKPKLVALETVGKTAQGRPLLLATLTDTSVSNEDKEHVVMTAQHSGVERSGATTTFRVMEWLLSGDPLARETLRRQVIFCMPLYNPDGYVAGTHANTTGADPHYSWTSEGPRDPEKVPEAVALQKIIDTHQPELLTDIHGLDMSFPEYYMGENHSGPYSAEIPRLLEEAALSEGYPTDWSMDGVRLAGIADKMGIAAEKLASISTGVDPGMYAYNRFHTIRLGSHNAWERSGLVRQRRLLRIGNEIWPGEYYPGYPTRAVMKNLFHFITAYGQTAAQRRRSRVELWSKQRQIAHGFNNPQAVGLLLYACATSPQALQRWLAKDQTTFTLRTAPVSLKGLHQRIGEHSGMEAAAIRRFLERLPEGRGQWGTEAGVSILGAGAKPEEFRPLEHGISMRLSVPFPKAKIVDLRLNGRPISHSEQDGYLTWAARAFTFIQINVPPERAKQEDLFIVTCEWDPREKRTHGEGW